MKTLLLIWSLVLGHCLAGPFFFGQQGAVSATPASSGFNPDNYISTRIWLSARQETAYSDGNTVETPVNRISGGAAVTQATVSKRPIYKTAVIGGQNAFRFDGVDDTWQSASTTINQANGITVIVVGKALNTANPLFIEQGPNVNSSAGFYVYGADGATMQKYAGAGWQANNATASTWLSSDLAVAIFVMRGDGTWAVWKNGTSISLSGVFSSGSYSAGSVSAVINIMSRNGSSVFSNIDVGDLIIGEGTLNSTQVSEIQTQLGALYGL